MGEFIFATVGLIVGGVVGVVVMSILTVSKKADRDLQIECTPENCTYRSEEKQ